MNNTMSNKDKNYDHISDAEKMYKIRLYHSLLEKTLLLIECKLKNLFVCVDDNICSADSSRMEQENSEDPLFLFANYELKYKLVKKIGKFNVGSVIDSIRVKIRIPEEYCIKIMEKKRINVDDVETFDLNLKFYKLNNKQPLNTNLENLTEIYNYDGTMHELLNN